MATESGIPEDVSGGRNPPLVSIGLFAYNEARFLRTTLESLLAQDYANVEIVISDNGSTDETEEICRDYAQRSARIRYYRQPHNVGPPPTQSTCWSRQRGSISCGRRDTMSGRRR